MCPQVRVVLLLCLMGERGEPRGEKRVQDGEHENTGRDEVERLGVDAVAERREQTVGRGWRYAESGSGNVDTGAAPGDNIARRYRTRTVRATCTLDCAVPRGAAFTKRARPDAPGVPGRSRSARLQAGVPGLSR